MKKLTKTQKQFMMLGGLVAVIIGVIIWVSVGGGGGELGVKEYKAKTISTKLADDVFENPEFKKLQSPVTLPLTPGVAGRENPFKPFN